MEIDIQHLRQWVGRREVMVDTVSTELTRRFAATFELEAGLEPGAAAPLLIHFCLAQPASPTSILGEDGHPQRGGFLPPVPLPRRMWAGGALNFHDDFRVGDVVTRTSTIADVSVKTGKSGILCFVAVEHVFEVEGVVVVTETQYIVYRGDAAGETPTQAFTPAPGGDHVERFDPSSRLLFRYSALTFNGHRIHYDLPYATDVEGYAGLVVHGPLQATLLLQFASRVRGANPKRFTFAGRSPMFADHPSTLNGAVDGERMRLWTAPEGGRLGMEAEAFW